MHVEDPELAEMSLREYKREAGKRDIVRRRVSTGAAGEVHTSEPLENL